MYGYTQIHLCVYTYIDVQAEFRKGRGTRNQIANIHWIIRTASGIQKSICVCVLVAQPCLTLCDPTDCSPPGFSVHGILQPRILEWIAIPFSRGTSQPRDWSLVSCIAGRFITVWATGKSIYVCFIDYAKHFDYVDHNKRWKILQEMGIPDHLNCLWRNLYAGQEATVRTGHRTTDCLQVGEGVHQGCILSPCWFILHAVYIMSKPGLDEAQAGIKNVGRNINNLRYGEDTTHMAGSKRN